MKLAKAIVTICRVFPGTVIQRDYEQNWRDRSFVLASQALRFRSEYPPSVKPEASS